MRKIPGLTPSSEDYLEAILALTGGEVGAGVRCVDVAARLEVSRASVTKAMQGLRDGGLVDQQPYGTVALTAEGAAVARRIIERHRTIRGFLTDVLGVEPQTADDDACRIEHVISQETMDRLAECWKAHATSKKQ